GNAGLVRDIAGGEDQRRLLAVQVGELTLELDHRMIVAGDVTGAASAGAHPRRRFDHGANHLRMLAHAKIIVRAPDHDRARAVRGMPYCMRETPGDALEIGKHAVAPFLLQPGERDGKEMVIVHSARSPSILYSTTGTLPIQSAPMPFDPEPSLVGPGEGAAGPREGGPAAGEPRRRDDAPGQAHRSFVCLR